ncbi:MAG: hypothetical protein AAFN74_27355, partial [Myxococcota bacterium]
LFSAALEVGELNLVLVAVIGSIVSVYYYLRVIVAFYMRDHADPGPTPTATGSRQLTLGLAIAAFFVVQLGIFPDAWIRISQAAIASLAS